jgi:phospholipase/carboxylesterase
MTKLLGLTLSIGILLTACATSGTVGGAGDERRNIVLSSGGSNPQNIIIIRPANYEPDRKYPLLVALHGYGGTAEGLSQAFASYAHLPILVAFPQGAFVRPAGGYSWFRRVEDRSQWPQEDESGVARILDCISAVSGRYAVKNVIVFGFSQGASLAYMTGLRNPALVEGIAAVAGGLPEIDGRDSIIDSARIAAARRVKIFIARGTDDRAVDRETYVRQKEYLSAHGFQIETMEFGGDHHLTFELLVRIWNWIDRSFRARG